MKHGGAFRTWWRKRRTQELRVDVLAVEVEYLHRQLAEAVERGDNHFAAWERLSNLRAVEHLSGASLGEMCDLESPISTLEELPAPTSASKDSILERHHERYHQGPIGECGRCTLATAPETSAATRECKELASLVRHELRADATGMRDVHDRRIIALANDPRTECVWPFIVATEGRSIGVDSNDWSPYIDAAEDHGLGEDDEIDLEMLLLAYARDVADELSTNERRVLLARDPFLENAHFRIYNRGLINDDCGLTPLGGAVSLILNTMQPKNDSSCSNPLEPAPTAPLVPACLHEGTSLGPDDPMEPPCDGGTTPMVDRWTASATLRQRAGLTPEEFWALDALTGASDPLVGAVAKLTAAVTRWTADLAGDDLREAATRLESCAAQLAALLPPVDAATAQTYKERVRGRAGVLDEPTSPLQGEPRTLNSGRWAKYPPSPADIIEAVQEVMARTDLDENQRVMMLRWATEPCHECDELRTLGMTPVDRDAGDQ